MRDLRDCGRVTSGSLGQVPDDVSRDVKRDVPAVDVEESS